MLTSALFIAAVTAMPMQEPPRAPALTNAETCLRDNVAEAVRVSSGASDAADFLVRYLCASPISAAASWQRNTEMLETMKGMLAGMTRIAPDTAGSEDAPEDHELADAEDSMDFFGESLDGITVDDTTGELIITDEPSGIAATMIRTQTGALGQMLDDPTPVFLRELAGRLVLEHRGRR